MRSVLPMGALAVTAAAAFEEQWTPNSITAQKWQPQRWKTWGSWEPSVSTASSAPRVPTASIPGAHTVPAAWWSSSPASHSAPPAVWSPSPVAAAQWNSSSRAPQKMPTAAPLVPLSTAEVPENSVVPSTTVIWGQKTSTVVETIDITVTTCPESVTARLATTEWVTQSRDSASISTWEPSASPQTPSSAPWSSATPSSSCQLPSNPLTNEQQVGGSLWGTLCQKTFPRWLNGQHGKKYEGAPWGEMTVHNSDATVKGDIPSTGVTRYYKFTISRGQISADGVLRDVILVNQQYPGPLIEANWGDMIEVTVHNNITNPMEGTSLHW